MKRRRIIPYDPRLKQRARELRKHSTLSEVLLWRKRLGIALLAVWCLASACNFSEYRRSIKTTTPRNRPIQVQEDGYISSQTCQSCHPRNYDTWYGSFHRTMTQVATPETVAGPINESFSFLGQTYRLQRRGQSIWFQMDAHDQAAHPVRMRLAMITGSHHMQVYWYATGHSRKLGQIPFIYLIEEQQWIPRNATFLTPPSPQIRSALPGVWNMACIKCHTTQGKTRSPEWGRSKVSPADLSFDTRVAEFGIACEACHGPGETHVRLNRNPLRRYRYHLNKKPDESIVQPARLSHQLSSQVCGQCHGILEFHEKEDFEHWMYHGYPYRPGEVLSETKLVVRYKDRQQPRLQQLAKRKPTFWEEKFWSDGMVRVSGREYNGLIESPCYQRGELSCLSCHAMHQAADDPRPLSLWAIDQLKPGMEGNPACLQCHESSRFNTPAHTHHSPNSTGSQCYKLSHALHDLRAPQGHPQPPDRHSHGGSQSSDRTPQCLQSVSPGQDAGLGSYLPGDMVRCAEAQAESGRTIGSGFLVVASAR